MYRELPPSIWLSTRVDYERYVRDWARENELYYYPGLSDDLKRFIGSYGRANPINLSRLSSAIGLDMLRVLVVDIMRSRYMMGDPEQLLPRKYHNFFQQLREPSRQREWRALDYNARRAQSALQEFLEQNPSQYTLRKQVGGDSAAVRSFLESLGIETNTIASVIASYGSIHDVLVNSRLGAGLGDLHHVEFFSPPPESQASAYTEESVYDPETGEVLFESSHDDSGFGRVGIATGINAARAFYDWRSKRGKSVRQRRLLKGATINGKKVGGRFSSKYELTDQEKQSIERTVKEALLKNFSDLMPHSVGGSLYRSVEQAEVRSTSDTEGKDLIFSVSLGDVTDVRRVPAGRGKEITTAERSVFEYARYVFFGSGPKRPVRRRAMAWVEGDDIVFATYVGPSRPRDIFKFSSGQIANLGAQFAGIYGRDIVEQLGGVR